MTLAPPEDLAITVISQTRIDLTWRNAGSDYHLIQIWIKEAAGAFVNVANIGGYNQRYEYTGCTENTLYTVKIISEWIHPVAAEASTGEVSDTTWAELQAPTLLVATPFSDTENEIIFKDNALIEDSHRLERKIHPGAYAEIVTLPPNVNYYRDSGLDNTEEYTYRAFAKQNGGVSANSNEDTAQPYSAPATPADFALIVVSDEKMRLSWTESTGTVTGYKIEMSIDGGANYIEIMKVRAGVVSYLIQDLKSSTEYYFKIRAYGPGGNSGYTAAANDTTDAQYSDTIFEKFVRDTAVKPVFLIEINPKMTLTGFSLTAAQTNTFEYSIVDRGIEFDAVWDDATLLAEKTSIATVEANAGSWWCDYHARKLYIHPTGSGDPSASLIEGGFWLYFTNHQDGDIYFNDHNYLPYFSKDDIPDFSMEIKSLFAGTFSIGSGSIKFSNPYDKVAGTHYFDKINEKFTWRSRDLVTRLGKETFTYSQFQKIFTGKIDRVACTDLSFTVNLKDMRKDFSQNLILNRYNLTDYPDLEEDFVDEPIGKLWGIKENVVAIPIDWDNKKFKFNDGRSKYVQEVKLNGSALTEDTHFYIDLQRSIIIFDRDGQDLSEKDIIEISFWGVPNTADEIIDKGAEIFIDLMIDHFGLSLSDLNLDEIYRCKQLCIRSCSVFIYKDQPYEEIIRQLEQTLLAYSNIDEEGRNGMKAREKKAPSDARYIKDHMIVPGTYREVKDHKDLLKTVKVNFNENSQTQEWDQDSDSDDDVYNKFGKVDREKEIFTYYRSPYYAALAIQDYLNIVNRPKIYFETSCILYGKKPGDIIKLSRTRAYSLDGMADDLELSILRIQMSPKKMTTRIIAEKFIDRTFEDQFIDSKLDRIWEKHNEALNKTIIPTSGILTTEIKGSVDGRWWCGFNAGPKIIRSLDYEDLGLRLPVSIITKLNSYTVNDDTMAGIFIGTYPKLTNGVGDLYAYKFGRHRDDGIGSGLRVQRNCGSYDLLTGAVAITMPVWLKIKIETDEKITFWYSHDGSTYTQYEHNGSGLEIADYYVPGIKIGLFAKNIDGNENLAAPFQFFKIEGS